MNPSQSPSLGAVGKPASELQGEDSSHLLPPAEDKKVVNEGEKKRSPDEKQVVVAAVSLWNDLNVSIGLPEKSHCRASLDCDDTCAETAEAYLHP